MQLDNEARFVRHSVGSHMREPTDQNISWMMARFYSYKIWIRRENDGEPRLRLNKEAN